MLAEPALFEALVDAQPEHELLQPYRVAPVLRVNTVGRAALKVYVYPPLVNILHPPVLIPLPRRVDEPGIL
ncbi:hypothetical protein D1872_271750 [compost metagenome]